jgi:Tfp pilus assembly protein PilO
MEKTNTKKAKSRIFSITTIFVAVLIIVIAANAVAWKNRLAKDSEINSLTNEIAKVTREIKTSPQLPTDLDARLTEAKAGLTETQTIFPAVFNRNDIIEYILYLSRSCQVEVLPISSQGWQVENLNQIYPVLKLNAIVTGNYTQINDFVSSLQHGKYRTLQISDISYKRQSSSDNTTLFPSENMTVTSNFNISIYANPASAPKGN